MKSLQRNKIFIIILVGISVVLSLNFFQTEVRGFFYSLSSPIQKSFWEAGGQASDFFSGIFRGGNFKKENEELNLKIQELLFENASLSGLREENKILRETLAIGLQKEFRLALAEVIGKDVGQDSILINVGAQDGILKDMPVVSHEKALLGRVVEVYQNFSKVMLISHKESAFDAKIADTDVAGVAKGQGGSELLLDLVPREKEMGNGELVLSSSLGGIYPAGLLVGLTREVKKSDIGPFQQAAVSPFFNVEELEKVMILLNFK